MRATTFLAILCFTAFVTHADDLQPPITTGLRVATCGHSFHVFTYHQVEQIALAAGLKLNVLKDVSDADKAKLNTLLQQIAWDTAGHHPMTGARKTGAN